MTAIKDLINDSDPKDKLTKLNIKILNSSRLSPVVTSGFVHSPKNPNTHPIKLHLNCLRGDIKNLEIDSKYNKLQTPLKPYHFEIHKTIDHSLDNQMYSPLKLSKFYKDRMMTIGSDGNTFVNVNEGFNEKSFGDKDNSKGIKTSSSGVYEGVFNKKKDSIEMYKSLFTIES